MATGDARTNVEIQRDDRQPGSRKPDAVSADTRFARTPFDRRGKRGCGRRRRNRDAPRGDRTGIRHPAAVRIVPGDAKIPIRSRRETESVLPKLLVGQIEQRSLRHEHRPALAIATALERQPLQMRDGQPFDSNHVDGARCAKVHFKAAALLRGGDIEEAAADPFPLGRRRVDRAGTAPDGHPRRRAGGRSSHLRRTTSPLGEARETVRQL